MQRLALRVLPVRLTDTATRIGHNVPCRFKSCRFHQFRMNCRYCDTPIATDSEAAVTHSYWQGLPFSCHAACKEEGVKREAFDCQTVDSDCNDCIHYQRGKLASRIVSRIRRIDGTITEVSHQPNFFVDGHCLKFNRTVIAQPKKWSGLECFEHRRKEHFDRLADRCAVSVPSVS